MAGERRLYLERNCRLPESPAHSRRRNREGPASSKGLNSQRGFGPAVEPRRKSRPRSTSLHGSAPCKCQRLSTLRWDRLPPSRPSTKSGARAGGRRLSDRRLHRWLAGTSASAPSSHGAADLLGLNRVHICVRNRRRRRCPCTIVRVRWRMRSSHTSPSLEEVCAPGAGRPAERTTRSIDESRGPWRPTRPDTCAIRGPVPGRCPRCLARVAAFRPHVRDVAATSGTERPTRARGTIAGFEGTGE